MTNNIFLDIETIPQQPEAETKANIIVTPPARMSKPETIEQWVNGEGKYAGERDALIEETYRKTALDGTYGEVVSIAFASDSVKFQMHREIHEPEEALLTKFVEVVREDLRGVGPYFIGHNIEFDLKFLHHRLVINKVRPNFSLPFSGRHGPQYFCTMQEWAGFKQRISQDKLCAALGIKGKPDDIDGSKVWDFVKAGNVQRVGEYNAFDVERVQEMYARLTFRF